MTTRIDFKTRLRWESQYFKEICNVFSTFFLPKLVLELVAGNSTQFYWVNKNSFNKKEVGSFPKYDFSHSFLRFLRTIYNRKSVFSLTLKTIWVTTGVDILYD